MQKNKLIAKIVLVGLLVLFNSCSSMVSGQQIDEKNRTRQPPSHSSSEQLPKSAQQPDIPAPQETPKKEEPPKQENKFPISFQTPIHDHSAGRLNNIRIAAKALCGVVIKRGAEFSFNNAVGERTEKAGYQEAIIFVDGKKVDGIGGGICQISTTIYNAALLAGFKITERHVHALPITYVEKGKDATVAYGLLDLKFSNNSPYDIKIWVTVTDDFVRVTFY